VSKRSNSSACEQVTRVTFGGSFARMALCVLVLLASTLGFAAPALAAKATRPSSASHRSASRNTRCTTRRRNDARGKSNGKASCDRKTTSAHKPAPLLAKASAPGAGADTAGADSIFEAPLTAGPLVAAPTVTSIAPTSGTTHGGTSVKIKGTGFVSGAEVWIGSKAASAKVESETEIVATTSEGRGKDEVVVSDSNGVSPSGPSFSYVAPPSVSSVSPSEGSTAGGTTVKIKGKGFLKGSKVKVGSEATSVDVVSETEVTAKTAAGSAGEDEVVVEDEIGKSTSGPSFTYVVPPTVTKVSPETGSTAGGTEVVITGTGFEAGGSGVTVKIGSAAAEVSVESETEIVAKTAATAAGKDEVVVSYADGVSSTGGPSFTYVAPPSVSSVAPVEGSTAGGTAVKIKGKGFGKSSKVKIGSEATSVVVVSETEITAKTAAGSAGKAEVVVEDEYGKSSGGPSFTYVTPAVVEKIEPETGSTAGGTEVVIKGTSFAKTAKVTVGKAATSVVWVSETEIKAKTAADTAGEDEVVVENVAGVPSTGGPSFTFIAPPTVTTVTPSQGTTLGGTEVVIKGTGFKTKGLKVKIGSEAASAKVESETEIKATTAAETAGKYTVVVEDEKGASTSGPSFSYVAPPSVSSVSPSEGSTAGGTTVKIKGKGFLKGSSVTIGKAARSVTVVSETEITAVTPAYSSGETEVVVEDEFGSSDQGVMFTFM